MRTASEELFEEYCNLRGYAFKRIAVVPGEGRFPDYEIQTSGGLVICEVKEITPNDEDDEYNQRLAKYGQASSSRPIGKRARAALKSACKQLRRFKSDPRPCVVVLLDTTYRGYLSPDEIDAAMYGDPVVLFPPHPADGQVVLVRGGNRRLNESRGLYISAVGVLRRVESEAAINLDIYHNNLFTSKRVSLTHFLDLQDRHFFKRSQPASSRCEWYEYVESRSIS